MEKTLGAFSTFASLYMGLKAIDKDENPRKLRRASVEVKEQDKPLRNIFSDQRGTLSNNPRFRYLLSSAWGGGAACRTT